MPHRLCSRTGFWWDFKSIKMQFINYTCVVQQVKLITISASGPCKRETINPLHATDLLWYPLKTSENQ